MKNRNGIIVFIVLLVFCCVCIGLFVFEYLMPYITKTEVSPEFSITGTADDSEEYDGSYNAGYDAGYAIGYNEGYHAGYDEGHQNGYDIASYKASLPTPTPVPSPAPTFNLDELWERAQNVSNVSNRPSNGQRFVRPTRDYDCVAPFEVYAPTDSDCYIYIHSLESSDKDIAFYLHKGESFDTLVPLGTYELYYATGNAWVSATASNNMVFGDSTVWNVSDDIFHFTDSGEYYNGYTVTLYSVYNGNMDTDVIDASDLPF